MFKKNPQFRNKIILMIGGNTMMKMCITNSLLKEDATVIVLAKSLHEIEFINTYVGIGGYGNLITELIEFPGYDDPRENYTAIVKKYGKTDLALGILDGPQYNRLDNSNHINQFREISQKSIKPFFISGTVILHMILEEKEASLIPEENNDRFHETDFSDLSKVVFNAKLEMSKALASKPNFDHGQRYYILVEGFLNKKNLPGNKFYSSNATEMVGYKMMKLHNHASQSNPKMYLN